jgi:hypothetical protein
VPHPWLRKRELTEVGVFEELPEYLSLVSANRRLEQMVESDYPAALITTWQQKVDLRVRELFDALLTPAHLRFETQTLFSGRAVIACGADLHLDQVGLPEEMAWTLFGPLLRREMGQAEAIEQRSPEAARTLDALLSRSWVIVSRSGPDAAPLAFHPVRHPEPVLRLHPLVCNAMNADFDGDVMAVFLPLTSAGQREAGERLSVAGRLRHDSRFLRAIQAMHAAKWGLVDLSRTAEGRREIADIAGREIAAPTGFLTKATLAEALDAILAQDGPDAALERIEALMQLGFRAAKESGASLGPFFGSSIRAERPMPPEEDQRALEAASEEIAAQFATWSAFDDDEMGPVLLAMRSGCRGSLAQLARIAGPWPSRIWRDGVPEDAVVRRSYADGLAPEDVQSIVRNHWEGVDSANREWLGYSEELSASRFPSSANVLARARAWKRPGIVFAAAAASGEMDPLTDPDSRLFVGV